MPFLGGNQLPEPTGYNRASLCPELDLQVRLSPCDSKLNSMLLHPEKVYGRGPAGSAWEAPGVPWKGCGCPAGSACEALGVPGKMRRPSGVSLRGPGRPREEVEGRGRQRLSYRRSWSRGRSAGRSPGCSTAGPFSFPDAGTATRCLCNPRRATRACGRASCRLPGTASSASGTFAKVPAAQAQR